MSVNYSRICWRARQLRTCGNGCCVFYRSQRVVSDKRTNTIHGLCDAAVWRVLWFECRSNSPQANPNIATRSLRVGLTIQVSNFLTQANWKKWL